MVGEVVIRSVSMFDGYRNYPEKTAAVLRNGWYHSGDYGFKLGEDYYIVGRKKDIIIVAGNNIYPEDVEVAVGSVPGVIPGRAIAFGQDDESIGSERLAVMVETEVADEEGKKRLTSEIVKAGMAIDVSIARVYLVPPRFLIKSSAGKPSRHANKERAAALA
jgi:acyl-CoA synthetase (AMP-forming)/AMP-acid ligase II